MNDKKIMMCEEANNPFLISSWGAAAVAFFVPMVVFLIFRINLEPLINSDPKFMVGCTPMSIPQVFSGSPDHYRPLSLFFETNIGYLYRLYGDKYHFCVLAIVAILNGLLSLSIYGICFNYCKDKIASLSASFLYVFSVAGIDATWHNLFSAFMLGPLLATCIAIFAYQQFRTMNDGLRWFWLIVFIVSCLIAPWFRELGYVPAATVFLVEILCSFKKRSLFFLLPGALFAHALVPKALPAFLGWYHGPLEFVFREGNINTNIFSPLVNRMSHSGWSSLSSLIHGHTAGFVINEMPPLLWLSIIPVVVYISLPLFLRLIPQRAHGNHRWQPPPSNEEERDESMSLVGRIVLGISGILLLAVFLLSFTLGIMDPILIKHSAAKPFSLIFLMLFTLFSMLRFGLLFPVWLSVTIPSIMLLATNHEIHTAFVVLPLAIICSLYLKELFHIFLHSRIGLLRQVVTLLVVIALTVAFFDHVSNFVTSFFDLKSITTAHKRIAKWFGDNVPAHSVVFRDFDAGSDIFYMLKSSSGYKYVPTTYEIIGGSPSIPQLDIIHRARLENRKVYYMHLRTYTHDMYLPMPVEALKKRASFEVDNYGFMVDPLRFAVDQRRFPRRHIPSEWDNSYGWVGFGKDRFVWRAEIEIYELIESNLNLLYMPSLRNPTRDLLPPKEANDIPKNDWAGSNDGAWENNQDTDIIPYETFISASQDRITRAVNTAGFGIANGNSYDMIAGKRYRVSFVMTKSFGVYPSFRISEDPYGNTSPLIYHTREGRMTYTFKAPKTKSFYTVFRVDNNEQSNFSVNSFSFKEI